MAEARIDVAALTVFATEAARYFESRPTGGEDAAHWSNVYNAENCRKIATALQSQADALAEARREISEASRYLDSLLRSYVGKYCAPVPEWQPLPDLIGMLTQIDNATTVTAEFEARATTAEASLATIREALEPILSLNVTDDELLRIRNRCETDKPEIKIWPRMVQMLTDAIREARALAKEGK